jgi:hypothetical protein
VRKDTIQQDITLDKNVLLEDLTHQNIIGRMLNRCAD